MIFLFFFKWIFHSFIIKVEHIAGIWNARNEFACVCAIRIHRKINNYLDGPRTILHFISFRFGSVRWKEKSSRRDALFIFYIRSMLASFFVCCCCLSLHLLYVQWIFLFFAEKSAVTIAFRCANMHSVVAAMTVNAWRRLLQKNTSKTKELEWVWKECALWCMRSSVFGVSAFTDAHADAVAITLSFFVNFNCT